MKTLNAEEFDVYWDNRNTAGYDDAAEKAVKDIIAEIRLNGDRAVKTFAAKFDKASPDKLEVAPETVQKAIADLEADDPNLAGALKFSAENIRRFSELQRSQFKEFETEIVPGVFTGQKVIPVERAAVYVPAGRFPLISTALMGLIPAFCAGSGEVILASPPLEDGLPDRRILAAAGIAAKTCGGKGLRVFAIGGAQAIAALALGTETIPRCDVIAGPGNKYVALAKRLLYGETGIDFVAGPTDVLIITGDMSSESSVNLAAADMLAQAEHDPDARARALVPNLESADRLAKALASRLEKLPTSVTAGASLESGGLIIIYNNKDEAIRIANTIAPEHLELQAANPETWIQDLKNYGSLFIGEDSAEVLGDYSAGINHTLPTSGSARFTGGLSVRHFLKTVTSLRCSPGTGYTEALKAAECIAKAEGLSGHAASAGIRSNS
ncbi:histidinol dehydrogenase [Spirochaetia bacterium]|nr:histidinol dehydrogenase [Spirochaetia bacterium]